MSTPDRDTVDREPEPDFADEHTRPTVADEQADRPNTRSDESTPEGHGGDGGMDMNGRRSD